MQLLNILRENLLILVLLFASCQTPIVPLDTSFSSQWSAYPTVDRPWSGEDYWLNPLQAWRQRDGKLHCEVSGGDRNAILLTRSINDTHSSFETSVQISFSSKKITENSANNNNDQNLTDGNIPDGLHFIGWAGFQIGLKGQFNDYRDDAIKGKGLYAGVTTDGRLFIGDFSQYFPFAKKAPEELKLQLTAVFNEEEKNYWLTLIAFNPKEEKIAQFTRTIHPSWLTGLMALTCSQSIPDTIDWAAERPKYTDLQGLNKRMGGNTTCAFSDWQLRGKKISRHDERKYGPILWTQHTLSNGILKMSVQMIPIGNDNSSIHLHIKGKEIQEATIDKDGRNALFKIMDWNSHKEHEYSVIYNNKVGKTYTYDGIIKKMPSPDSLKLAALSCVDDRGFPHQDLVDNVAAHKVDIYSFHGDQLYERVGEYGVERNSKLDYLRKWYVFGWSFRELMRNNPTIIIPDDHDVFHGNLWGCGGKAADVSLGYGYDAQDSGGYKEPPEFVNMVHRTQTGHLPDPFDATPVQQNISVYYNELNYGGVSFAILGDRQWKSAPQPLFPDAAIENGWPQNKSWNAKTEAFHPEAELLGQRQEQFLEHWVSNWSENTYFKTLISQSPFCNIATLPADIYHDKYVPGLPRYKKGEYPPDDRPVADFDSNGWPQNKRNDALKIIRKAFALHVTGDQHLGSTGHYGVDEYGDAGFWISTPAVSNLWPRRWFPAQAATDGKMASDTRRYTGNFEDGFGNKITVRAIANPYDIDRQPSMVFDKAPGYSIIRFDKKGRTMQLEVWPRWASPKQEKDNKPYEGWPVQISQTNNYGKKIAGHLPPLQIEEGDLVKVFKGEDKTFLYAIKPKAGKFEPFIFEKKGTYKVEQWRNGVLVR